MTIRVQRLPSGVGDADPTISDRGTADIEVFETHFDGQTLAWGPNQHRSFIDDGVGHGHGSNLASPSIVFETGLFATNNESRA